MDFDAFFASSCAEMLARALVLSGSRHDAEDAVQEAYAEAWSGWDRISAYDNPGAWVYKIVRQRLWKASKRWRRLSPLSSADLTAWRATDGDPERFAEAATALAALAELPNRQRMVLVMHCLQQMGQQQIADELGLSRGAVAASIFKARRNLEKALGMKDTGLAALEGPGSSVAAVDAGPRGRAIAGGHDPLAAALEAVLSWLVHAERGGDQRLRERVVRRGAR
jgi:RNA polymerase sigma factor (sigma-70 family)